MEITIEQVQGKVPVTILHVRGNVDGSNFNDLTEKARAAHEAGARNLLIDLSETPYMSSAGLAALQIIASLYRGDGTGEGEEGWTVFEALDDPRTQGLQQRLKLLNPQPRVDSVLELVGFKDFLPVYTSRDAAIASFS
jgi:anti-anti-sigma factor